MPAQLPEVAVEDKSDFGALASGSSILASPAPASTFVPPPRPEAIGKVQESISALMPDYTAKRKAVEEAEKQSLESRKATLAPAIEKLKAAAGANAPPPPLESPEPAVPDISPRAFLGGEGKNALQQIVAGLGLLVSSAVGAKRAPAQALGALTGAMRGWAEGDAERASRDWHHYEGLVAKMNRENQKAVKAWERALVIRGGNQQDAKLFFEGAMAEAGLTDMAADYAGKDYQRIGTDLTMMQGLLTKMDSAYRTDVETAFRRWEAGEKQRHSKAIEDYNAGKAKHADAVLDQLKKYQGEMVEIKKRGPTAQLDKNRVKITEAIAKLSLHNRSVDESLNTLDQMQASVDRLAKKDLLVTGPSAADAWKAQMKRALDVGDEEALQDMENIKRWGTSLVFQKELELGMKASVARLKIVGEAEAGHVLELPKSWWDQFFVDSRRILDGTKKINAPVMKAYQDTLRHLGPVAPPSAEPPTPSVTLDDLGIKWED